ncbi:MAG: hypothetical protein M3436_13605 [Pseudomonadota bacterium]|nr:hypothetical protein [Pseudomonadota bacterium]
MIVVGALVEWTATGVDPVDGGVAIWQDGALRFVLPEERVTRRKYSGGFRRSLSRGLNAMGKTIVDLDGLSFASYGETRPLSPDHIVRQAPELEPVRERIEMPPSHHELHALYGFRHSPFGEALVVVLDNEGMVLGPQRTPTPFPNSMERCSYYLGGPNGVDLLTRDLYGKDDVSLGETFRRFNYYCGFLSHQYSGKTMALAGYGNAERFRHLQLISAKEGVVRVDLDPNVERPGDSVVSFFQRHGIAIAPPCAPHHRHHQDHLDAAAFVQRELEMFVANRVEVLLLATGMRALVLTGGVAYNCRMVGIIERRLGIPVFVPRRRSSRKHRSKRCWKP